MELKPKKKKKKNQGGAIAGQVEAERGGSLRQELRDWNRKVGGASGLHPRLLRLGYNLLSAESFQTGERGTSKTGEKGRGGLGSRRGIGVRVKEGGLGPT